MVRYPIYEILEYLEEIKKTNSKYYFTKYPELYPVTNSITTSQINFLRINNLINVKLSATISKLKIKIISPSIKLFFVVLISNKNSKKVVTPEINTVLSKIY